MFLLTSVTPQSTAQANKISLRSLWLLCRALIGLDLIYCYLTLPFLWITRDFFSLHIQIYARLYNAAASQPRPLGLGCSLAIILFNLRIWWLLEYSHAPDSSRPDLQMPLPDPELRDVNVGDWGKTFGFVSD